MITQRRQGLKAIGFALAAAGSLQSATAAPSDVSEMPTGSRTLETLTKHLAALPRRRDFKTVPMILMDRGEWDADALDAVIHYAGGPRQSWDNTDLHGSWLNVMRNALNTQVWGFKHPDFLCVSATHGPAHLALFDDALWEKYDLAKLAGGNLTHNSFVAYPAPTDAELKDPENPMGPYSPHSNSIQALQRRGVVFLACHNAIWELSNRLVTTGNNPDKLTTDTMCAEFSNHLIPDIILTPGAVGTLVELSKAGFAYAR